ncbi:Ureidoglycolate lyase [Candidatus Hydrogenisulfobacillus filiaventi]|uniref:Ureidoglycolate lyase n=1 Tax=Candidatus Hydrogenisulfobacillus filiaventi TaxID=2707344 RepID=A0A6F8ZDF1_9FIRM|nr:Ureidoglycolate lyase [Candidatus Hydrogenisulfobacillus filiaventi]
MRLANVIWEGGCRLALGEEDGASLRLVDPARFPDTDAVLAAGAGAEVLRAAAGPPVPAAEVRWLPAVRRPGKIFCIGLNYRRHAAETGSPVPASPVVFSKFPNALAGHRQVVTIPAATRALDYEAELVVVIGRRVHRVRPEEALAAVWGYTIGNDLSARDLQFRTGQWLLGKSADGFAPLGPYLVSAGEAGDPQDQEIRLWLNGEERQHSSTADMIFGCAELVAALSEVWTLEPGDLIFTGTPEGVIWGRPPEQQVWIRPGDVTRIAIGRLGVLETTFAAEEPAGEG